jgi:hypothetical protein
MSVGRTKSAGSPTCRASPEQLMRRHRTRHAALAPTTPPPPAKMTKRQPMCRSTRYGSAFRPAVREKPTGLRTLRCVYAWLHMHMLWGRTRHAKTPCPQPDGTSYTALCVHVAAYAYASGQDAPRKDALPPTRRDFVHCVVCTRGCICICFGAGRATPRRPAPNPTGPRTLRCVYGLVFGHFGPRTLRCVHGLVFGHFGPRTLRCVHGLVFGHFGPFFPRSILFPQSNA